MEHLFFGKNGFFLNETWFGKQGGFLMILLPITGTIRNTVKMAEMDNKWQERKKNLGKNSLQQVDPLIQRYQEDLKRMRENSVMASIDAKLKSGAQLTSKEIEYLKKNNPTAYQEYMEMCAEKEAYKRQLRSCKTKDDVQKLKINKMGSFLAEAKSVMNNPNIPKGSKVGLLEKILKKVMGIQSEHMKFVQSSQYGELPTETELAEEIKDEKEKSEIEVSPAEPDNEEVEETPDNADNENVDEDGKPKEKNKEPVMLQELTENAETGFHELWTILGNYMKAEMPGVYESGYGYGTSQIDVSIT